MVKDDYKPEEVKKDHQESKWYDGIDFSCWAMSTFSSHSDFYRYYEETGENGNYSEMKSEMISGLSISANSSSTEASLPEMDIDVFWLDFGDAFSRLFSGIGGFIGEIIDGV